MTKPPLGLKPRFIHEEQRLIEIRAAIMRYLTAGLPVRPEWLTEYNEILTRRRP